MVAALHEARPPDLARQFLSSGENGLSHSVRWRELGRWGRRCRLPARTESGPLFESDRGQASTACPTRGLTANSTTSGVLKYDLIFCAGECERSLTANAAYFSHNWDSAFVVGQAILPAAAFPGGSWGRRRVLVSRKSRLKAGCSHDWLPHYSCRQTPIKKFAALAA